MGTIAAIVAFLVKWGPIIWKILSLLFELSELKGQIADPQQREAYGVEIDRAVEYYRRTGDRRPLLGLRRRMREHCWGRDCHSTI